MLKRSSKLIEYSSRKLHFKFQNVKKNKKNILITSAKDLTAKILLYESPGRRSWLTVHRPPNPARMDYKKETLLRIRDLRIRRYLMNVCPGSRGKYFGRFFSCLPCGREKYFWRCLMPFCVYFERQFASARPPVAARPYRRRRQPGGGPGGADRL